jgi:acetoin utilization deacetylase AcuC-like enzyme
MTTLVLTDDVMLEHRAGPMHPESPGRLLAILDLLDRVPVAGVQRARPRAGTRQELLRVHQASHVDRVLALDGQDAQLDADTAMSPRSVQASLLAAGAAVELTERILSGEARNGFALVRPPGHHAERTHAMGFCLFNNVAVAAEAARQQVERVLVVDWDVHHGNGTQAAFLARSDVLFMSAHQWPLYPGSGAAREVGHGEGVGYTVNCPLPPGQGDGDYGAVFERLFLPVARAFRPQLVLVSAGFDPHRADPLGGMDVTERGFAAMCSALKELAEDQCQGRLGLLLEGGYDLDGLSGSVHACLEVLAGRRKETFPGGAGRAVDGAVAASAEALQATWGQALRRG